MMEWMWLQLLLSMLFGHLVCLPDDEDVTHGVAISFVTEYIHFIQRDMPDTVQLNMTTEGDEVTHVVTLFKRPERFQNAPVYVQTSAGRTQWTQARTAADPLLDTQELTWYTTRPNTALHLAACIVRVHQGHSQVSVHLKDDGFLVLNDTAYSLKYIPPVKRNSGALSERYLLTKRRQHPSSLHRTLSSPGGINIDTVLLGCTNVYLDMCVHADFDVYDRRGRSLSKVHTHVRDVMNEVHVLYNMLPSGNGFNFRVHVELASIFVETSIFNDPLKLRQTPMTQAIFNGWVYQDLISAHDLLTAWLERQHPAQCDHYILFTGTYPAEFELQEDEVKVYSSFSLGLSWDGTLCQEDPGRRCSLVHDVTAATAFTVAHETGHNLGLPHVMPSKQCPAWSGQAMMAPSLQYNARATVHWQPCTVSKLQQALDTCLSTTPNILTIGKATLDAACRLWFGPDSTYNWDGREVNQSSVCKWLECISNGKGPVHTITTPRGIPCGPKKECDGYGACISTTTADQCDA